MGCELLSDCIFVLVKHNIGCLYRLKNRRLRRKTGLKNPGTNPGQVPGFVAFGRSEQLELLGSVRSFGRFGSIKNFDHPELFIRNRHDANMPFFG